VSTETRIEAPTDEQSLSERLRADCVRDPATGCLLWMGYRNVAGYGRVSHGGQKNLSVHRLAYRLWVGELPTELHVDHLCRVRNCVEPTHMQAVEPRENVRLVNARKTTCKRGHPLSGDNLYINAASGSRVCRTCMKEHRERYAARPEKIALRASYVATERYREGARRRARACADRKRERELRALGEALCGHVISRLGEGAMQRLFGVLG
jgi:hypothetical protein